MMETRVNVIIPKALLDRSKKLIKEGYFSNFSELVREGLRGKIMEYHDIDKGGKDEKKV